MGIFLKALFNRRMLAVFFMGIASGAPLLLTSSTLKIWLTDSGVGLATIGLFSLVHLPYTLKFLWAPLLDRFIPPFLGRRRGWALTTQVILLFLIAALGRFNPLSVPLTLAMMAMAVAFFSASQDIVLDAYRREILTDAELGLGSSIFINGYRLGTLVAGAGALTLADQLDWSQVYGLISLIMLVGVASSFLAPEPRGDIHPPHTLKEAVVNPFLEFFSRPNAGLILVFLIFYKIGDNMAAALTDPFMIQLGFSKIQIAAIGKTFGLVAIIVGGLGGGLIMLRLGIVKALWIFGLLQMVSTLSFAGLNILGKNLSFLAFTIGFENLATGMGTAAYAAYMASLCNKNFTATQYALLSSLMGIPRVLAGTPTGYVVQALGWTTFFIFCTLAAIPGLLLLSKIAPLPLTQKRS